MNQMTKSISELAKEYTDRSYPFQVFKDEEGVGQAKYMAKHPDIEGCMAQGASQSEAIQNLNDARHDLIEFLLKRGLPIPEPYSHASPNVVVRGSNITNLTIDMHIPEQTIEDVLGSSFVSKAIERDSRELLYEALLETLA